MDKILLFKIFCLENYKIFHNLSGKTAFDIFNKYRLFDYITDHYDTLHSFGLIYLVNDIDEFIAHRKK